MRRLPCRYPVRSQSAMEYLMTYGWAILIIAVVLGALYSLGVFNMSAYMPKIGPGACHVFRPNGPSTSWNVALTGSCAGYLPQYVAQFNGQSSYITISNWVSPDQISVSLWLNTIGITGNNNNNNAYQNMLGSVGYAWHSTMDLESSFSLVVSAGQSGSSFERAQSASYVPEKTWEHVVMTCGPLGLIGYVNGQAWATNPNPCTALNSTPANLYIGITSDLTHNFNGSISNVQIYNTSLTANQIQYLYNEGISGAPIYLQHLIGWWPLNGDTKDYSGNNNNGVPTAIAYNGSWTSGYYH